MLIDLFVKAIKEIKPDYVPYRILDIGSRDGEQALEFSKVWSGSTIFVIEPNPDQYLKCYQAIKHDPTIFSYEIALSETNGIADFYVCNENVGASSLLEPLDIPFASDKSFKKISVRTRRLDDFVINLKSTILWIDVQGAELSVLKGAGVYLNEVDFIHCEASPKAYYKGHQLLPEVQKYLEDHGFDCTFYALNFHPYGEGDLIAINRRFLNDKAEANNL